MRQVVLSIIVIVAVLSLAALGTYAGFVDTEVSPDNTIQLGTIDLQLGDTQTGGENYPSFLADEDYGQDPLGDSVNATWNYIGADENQPIYPGGMEPGDWLEGRVKIRNFGTVPGDSLCINCAITNYDQYGDPTDPDVPKDAVMAVDYLRYYNNVMVNIVWTSSGVQHWDSSYISDEDGDGRITLHDWKIHAILLDPPALADGVGKEESFLDMKVVFDPPGVGETARPYWREDQYSGYRTRMTLIFVLN